MGESATFFWAGLPYAMLGRGGIALLEYLAEMSLDDFAGWGLVDRLATGDLGATVVLEEYDKLGSGGAAEEELTILLAGF